MTDRPKERVARELAAIYEEMSGLKMNPTSEAMLMDADRIIEALRSGGEEVTTLGDFIGWMRENDLVIVHREDSNTPTTETDAPGEGEEGGDFDASTGHCSECGQTLPGLRWPDPDEGSGEWEEWPGASAFERGYQAGRRDEAYFRSRPEPTVEGEDVTYERLAEVLTDFAGLQESEGASGPAGHLREAARRLRERPEGERVEGWVRRGDYGVFVVTTDESGFSTDTREPATLIIHQTTEEEG